MLSVIGARPEIIQAAPLSAALRASGIDEVLVHTGQHYDTALSGDQIVDTRLPRPDYHLDVGSLPDLEQLELSENRLRSTMDEARPAAVLVRGDTNATLAGARAAAATGLPLLHVEAGLRSGRADMPEERNRIETDRRSDLLFAPTRNAVERLSQEQIAGRVELTGDVLCDMFESCRGRVRSPGRDRPYVLATIHRNYNTDQPRRLAAVLDCLEACGMPVVLPLHPRTLARISEFHLRLPAAVETVAPVAYTEMLGLERDAEAILTDSGGVQREAYLWGVPCITLREETEWTETVETGWNVLAGADPALVTDALARPRPASRPPVLGDGQAARRVAELTSALLAVAA